MRLQLDSSTLSPSDSGRVSAAASTGESAAARLSESRGSGHDSIGISGTSAALSRLSLERGARIQQLAGAVRAGTYNVSGSAVSAAIVGHGIAQGIADGGAQ